MNILYIGPYRQLNSSGLLSRDYLLSLISTGENIISRPLYIDNDKIIDRNTIYDTEKIDNNIKYDYLIQHAPYYMTIYDKDFGTNCAIFKVNTKNTKWTNIKYRSKLLDKIFVETQNERAELSPISSYTINTPINVDTNQTIDILQCSIPKDNFIFYSIKEDDLSYNLDTLVIAFLLEFSRRDNVSLIIYNKQDISQHIINIKQKLKKYNNLLSYKEITLLSGNIIENYLYRLHKTGNCYVVPARSQCNNQQLLYAGLFKNSVIVTDNLNESFNNQNSWLINNYLSPILQQDNPVMDIDTGRELWTEPIIVSLQEQMRHVFEQQTINAQKSDILYNQIIQTNSYKQIGQNIIQCLTQ